MDLNTLINVLVIVLSLVNLGALIWVVLAGLKIYNGPVASMKARVTPMVDQGKAIAAVGKERIAENQTRIQALMGEVKGIYGKVRTTAETGSVQTTINFQSIMTAISVISTLRRGLSQLNAKKKPTSNPPGPPVAKKHSLPRRMGTLSMVPDIVRFVMDMKRSMRA